MKQLVFCALLGASLPLQAAPTLVPNGDFSTAAGDSWAEVNAGGTFAYSYPGAGGNPVGYGVIDHSANDGGWGIWVADNDAVISLASLGLTAGESYQFFQDMTILSGTNIGGFKVDFFTGAAFNGSTGDTFPSLIGDGTTWETYTFEVTIPATADGIKVVPLWGAGSSIGYDNVSVDPTPVVLPPIPNADFESGSASWFELGAPNTTFSYPGSGGNPGGYGVMTNDGGGFGIWVANGGAPLALSGLGLAGGDTANFTQDMTLLSGSNIGGLKIEFLQGATFLSDSGNMIPALIGDGSTWENYSFEVPIPINADHIKLVPLWGTGSSVGYDNFSFAPVALPPLAVDISLGTVVSWSTTSEMNLFQPQKSENGSDWADLGPVLVGNEITSVFDGAGSPFYRVLESTVEVEDAALNGGFETVDPSDSDHAESWTHIGSQPPTRITGEARTGNASLQIMVLNDETPTANNSEIQQNIANAGGAITPGNTYDFSFWAKQKSSGVSYVQQYRLQWLDGGGGILAGGIEFTPFSGGTGEWAEIAVADLAAPAGAQTALIQIFGATGAVAGATAQGEVLIDDLSLVTASTLPSSVEVVANGNFENLDPGDPDCSEFWTCVGTQLPTNVIDDSLSGIASMELRVENDGTATPNSSEIQHNILDGGGTIVPGTTYDFSFWAKQVSSGVSYVQQYRLRWLDGGGGDLAGGVPFTSFPATTDAWTETSVPGLVAPAGAVTAVIQIVASTGGVAGPTAEGTVLIDDASLRALVAPDVLAASPAAGVEIAFATEAGKTYQLKRGLDLLTFDDFGSPITGDDGTWTATDLMTAPGQFYKVTQIAP